MGGGVGTEVVRHPFDERYGVETSGLIGGGDLATGHEHDVFITAYAGIAPSRFQAAMERWRAELGGVRVEECSFVDLGCGKGRALLLGGELPFREAVGVELNPGLAEIAERNVAAWVAAGRARCPVRVVVGDATELELPDGPCVVFLYNSFAEPLVRRVAERLAARANDERGKRRVDLIYQNAEFGAVFVEWGWREVWRGSLPLSEEDAAADPVASPADVTAMYRVG
jgi:SAM-dependent methyltransferase